MTQTLEAEVPNSESLKSPKQPLRDKDILLEAYDAEQSRAKNISFKNLLYVYLAIFIALALILPKIYISNEIYYASKNITQMYHTYTALQEENAYLKGKLEQLHYKIEVLDEIDDE